KPIAILTDPGERGGPSHNQKPGDSGIPDRFRPASSRAKSESSIAFRRLLGGAHEGGAVGSVLGLMRLRDVCAPRLHRRLAVPQKYEGGHGVALPKALSS